MAKWLIYTIFALTVMAGIRFFPGLNGDASHTFSTTSLSFQEEAPQSVTQTDRCVVRVPAGLPGSSVVKTSACASVRLGAVDTASARVLVPTVLPRFLHGSLYALLRLLFLLQLVSFFRWQKQGFRRLRFQRHATRYHVFALRRLLI